MVAESGRKWLPKVKGNWCRKWNELPKNYQAILATAAATANQSMLAKYDAVNPPALRRLVAAGTELRAFPQPIMEAALKAANEYYADLASTGADEVFQLFGSVQTGVPFLSAPRPGGYANATALGLDIAQRFLGPQPQYLTISFADSANEVVGPPRVPGTLGRKFVTNHAYTVWSLVPFERR